MKDITSTSQSPAPHLEGSLARRLVGVWALVDYVEQRPDREDVQPFGPHPQGFLIYTADGFVSAQLMKPGYPGSAQEHEGSGDDYIAYCGTYEVDEASATVTHIPSVSLFPNLLHERLCRSMELQGDRLVLRVPGGPDVDGLFFTSRLEWKRITSNVAPSTERS